VITPGLFRRSLRRALRWRLLLLWWAALAVPGAIAAAPVFAFFRAHLDRATSARDVVAWMDGATLLELARQLGEDGAGHSILFAMGAAVAALLVCAPFVAGAMVASARGDESLPFPRLLAAAGELYGRMLRTSVAGVIPLGAGVALALGAFRLAADAANRAATETAADRGYLAAGCAGLGAVFVAHLLVDAGRAQFAVVPGRRSAAAAIWSGLRVVFRHPARALGIGALGAAAGLGGGLGLMAIRLQIAQSGPLSLALAWLLAQGAQIAIGFGRAARIEGLAELTRADAAERLRADTPPAGAPGTEVVHSTTLSALEPPRSGAPR
jgi:hypothetical protein